MSCANANYEITEILLKNKINPNLQNSEGNTALRKINILF